MTKYIPAGYMGKPEDIAYCMLYLASDEARYITGQTIVVDGGQILPESLEALEEAPCCKVIYEIFINTEFTSYILQLQ